MHLGSAGKARYLESVKTNQIASISRDRESVADFQNICFYVIGENKSFY